MNLLTSFPAALRQWKKNVFGAKKLRCETWLPVDIVSLFVHVTEMTKLIK